MAEKKIAIVLVRGLINTSKEVKDTLRMLNVHRRNVCAVLNADKSIIGMLNKVKDYATFGEIDEETIKLLKAKKGDSKYYRLNSPRKGYGRKGIKYDFTKGGALGYRGDKINDLIRRML